MNLNVLVLKGVDSLKKQKKKRTNDFLFRFTNDRYGLRAFYNKL